MAPLTAAAVLVAASFLARAIGASSRTAAQRRVGPLLRHEPGPGAQQRARAAGARWWAAHRSARVAVDGLPALLEDVARGVRAGSSLGQACTESAATVGGPAAARLASAVSAAERGQPLAQAFTTWAATSTVAEERLAAGALALAARAGGPQARAIDGVATTLRERRAVAAEVHAQSAQARLSAVVIGVLPVLFLLWAVATDRRTAAFLVATPAGGICLGAGLGLELAGAAWMRRLLRGATP